ncbi:uncharacterized protein BP5553_01078 [Venustampulla echinocandica]|uniref:Uncharacterized protein n=1 Tax=Venustampulla echinocandica TaxID=2656787 RepID=A0A370TZZ9_9HELO|nr:uncharacterized protein BP5553_01078 [Venustampulla echinocandica]RDL41099.1 hypothetical protein BP5553_01078 [Venustampulla echinocandica]
MRPLGGRRTARCFNFATAKRKCYSQKPPTTTKPFLATDSTPLADADPASSVESQPGLTPPQQNPLSKNDISPRPRRELPVSPLMDPAFLQAKQAPHTMKAKPSNDSTELQQQLLKNPYALALASPLRKCQMTDTLLPRFFLQGFSLVADPETGKSYYTPRDAKEKKSCGPVTYMLAQQPLVARMHDNLSGYGKNPQIRLLSNRIKQHPDAMQLYQKAEFRCDMDTILLERSRRRVCDLLLSLLKLKRGYMTGFKNWDDLKSYSRQAAVVLWIGGDGDAGEASIVPGEFATVLFPSSETKMSREIPVHNLSSLLGEEKLDDLRNAASSTKSKGADENKGGIFHNPIISIKARNMTTQLQVELWWLQGYLAKHGFSY